MRSVWRRGQIGVVRIVQSGRERLIGRCGDRGEFGPMAYAVMVSAMVLLALVVVAWGDRIANLFMDQVEVPAGGGDGGDGGNGDGGGGGGG